MTRKIGCILIALLTAAVAFLSCSEKLESPTAPNVKVDTVLVPTIVHDTIFDTTIIVQPPDTIIHVDTILVKQLDTLITFDTTVVYDTSIVFDTTVRIDTFTVYITHVDTINIHDTTYLRIIVVDTLRVPVYDTIFVPYTVLDTVFVPYVVNHYDTIRIPVYVHDTTYVQIHHYDTTFVPVYITVYDTVYQVHTDTIYIDRPSYRECHEWVVTGNEPSVSIELNNSPGTYLIGFDVERIEAKPTNKEFSITIDDLGSEEPPVEYFFSVFGQRARIQWVGPIYLGHHIRATIKLRDPYYLPKLAECPACPSYEKGRCFWFVPYPPEKK